MEEWEHGMFCWVTLAMLGTQFSQSHISWGPQTAAKEKFNQTCIPRSEVKLRGSFVCKRCDSISSVFSLKVGYFQLKWQFFKYHDISQTIYNRAFICFKTKYININWKFHGKYYYIYCTLNRQTGLVSITELLRV